MCVTNKQLDFVTGSKCWAAEYWHMKIGRVKIGRHLTKLILRKIKKKKKMAISRTRLYDCKFNPCSIALISLILIVWYCLIKKDSRIFLTNGSLLITFSIGKNFMLLCEWPGNRKCTPTGKVVLDCDTFVIVHKCLEHLHFAEWPVSPTYCGWTFEHSPSDLSQLITYIHFRQYTIFLNLLDMFSLCYLASKLFLWLN